MFFVLKLRPPALRVAAAEPSMLQNERARPNDSFGRSQMPLKLTVRLAGCLIFVLSPRLDAAVALEHANGVASLRAEHLDD